MLILPTYHHPLKATKTQKEVQEHFRTTNLQVKSAQQNATNQANKLAVCYQGTVKQ